MRRDVTPSDVLRIPASFIKYFTAWDQHYHGSHDRRFYFSRMSYFLNDPLRFFEFFCILALVSKLAFESYNEIFIFILW